MYIISVRVLVCWGEDLGFRYFWRGFSVCSGEGSGMLGGERVLGILGRGFKYIWERVLGIPGRSF